MSHESVACSAPGKVLLAGGYLVLDRAYTGLVIALDARIHVYIQSTFLPGITVRSPQFPESEWLYDYGIVGHGVLVRQSASISAPPNSFVETALSYVLSYICALTPSPTALVPCVITILADNDYYSLPRPRNAKAGSRAGRDSKGFASFPKPLWETHKTGLGSSAALVTALTSALLSYYLDKNQYDFNSEAGLSQLHNLAQTVHCAAQGKVGSGFDVASAVFGSCVYRRFSPSVVEKVGEPESEGFAKRLRACVEDGDGEWDVSVSKDAVAIPQGLRVVMCDVDCGSQTPGMVNKVLDWYKADPAQAGKLWLDLQSKNDELAAGLVRASHGDDVQYIRLRQLMSDARRLVRDMSRLSGVAIEPPSQTRLLDACLEITGVVGGVVPGAGGYDAVLLLVEDTQDTVDRLEEMLKEWDFDESGTFGHVRLLGAKGELAGVRLEESKCYIAWTA